MAFSEEEGDLIYVNNFKRVIINPKGKIRVKVGSKKVESKKVEKKGWSKLMRVKARYVEVKVEH